MKIIFITAVLLVMALIQLIPASKDDVCKDGKTAKELSNAYETPRDRGRWTSADLEIERIRLFSKRKNV